MQNRQKLKKKYFRFYYISTKQFLDKFDKFLYRNRYFIKLKQLNTIYEFFFSISV